MYTVFMVEMSGVVERVTYHNEENGYTVLKLRPESLEGRKMPGMDLEGLVTVVGNFPDLSPGVQVRFEGNYITHPRYGLQFKADHFEKQVPITLEGIERYLGSGMIKGIGTQLAKRIVKHFKYETLEIIEENPKRLAEVPGIGPDRTKKIVDAWNEQRQIKEIMLFLHGNKISTNLAVKIYKTYGEQSLEIVRKNPYQLEQDIYGIGFKTADRIARNLGLPHDHPSRIEAGILYAINAMTEEGHVYVPLDSLSKQAADLLEVEEPKASSGITRLKAQGRIIRDIVGENTLNFDDTLEMGSAADVIGPVIYLTSFYYSEKGIAEKISQMLQRQVKPRQGQFQLNAADLSREQQHAIETAFVSPVSIITGGPGTGKTTCLKALIERLEDDQLRYALASPTGRAAKRLSEATGRPAHTIHRLLGFAPGKGFQFNENKPLKIDYLIVDEASMLDLMLTFNLLRAVRANTQLLFVGDVDQLPSVGAGDVLRDLIKCEQIPVFRLTKIFRQDKGSLIIDNAHKINQGQMPQFTNDSQGDFFLFPAKDAETAADWVGDLVSNRIPQNFKVHPAEDIQVLTPIYRGPAGVDALNIRLQGLLNPPSDDKVEQKLFGRIFRVGDKVMQIRNNYDKNVFNGDIGFIVKINRIEQSIVVMVDHVLEVRYDFSEADELVLAYAVSVHKSQGSEFPVIVMPVLTQHYIMLQRNLIYTGVTRAKKICVIVGNSKALRIAINNDQVSQRNSNLAKRIMDETRNRHLHSPG